MTVSLSTVHMTVDDPDAALAFYRDTLGLTVRNEVANDGFRWITLSPTASPTSRSCCRSRTRPLAGGRRRPRGAAREGRRCG